MTPVPESLPSDIREYSVRHTFDRDFINAFNRCHRQYGDEPLEILGVANRNLDIARFSDEFFSNATQTVADISVDDNANVSEKNISHYESESTKALQKLDSLATLYVWVKKCFSKKEADTALEKIINGEIFVSDLHSFKKPYCFAFDLRNMLYEGMSFFKGNFRIKPPKRTESFIAQFIQSVAFISNQIAGACMHQNQKVVISEAGVSTPIKARDLFERFNEVPTILFKHQESDWETRDVSSLGFQIWENNRFVSLKKVYRRTYSKDIFVVKTASGKELRVTEDHIFKVIYRGREIEVKAKDLSQYDTVVNTQMLNIPINKEGYLYQLGQVLGILCGDGCLTQINMLTVSINDKQEFIADFLDSFFERNYGKKGTRTPDVRGACFTWCLSSKEIQRQITNFFSAAKETSLLCDSKYINMEGRSLDFKLGFLDGILVTDGAWNHSFKLSLVNKKLIEIVCGICAEVGVSEVAQKVTPSQGNKKELYSIIIPNRIKTFLSLMPLRFTARKEYSKCDRKEVGYVGKTFAKSVTGESTQLYHAGFCSVGNGNLKRSEYSSGLTDVVISILKEENNHPYVYEVETETGWYSCGGILTHNCAFPDALVVWDYFLRAEYGADYMSWAPQDEKIWSSIKNQFQNFIFSVNFPFRGAGQSAFTNLSVLDRGFMKSLFTKEGVSGSDYMFPDGTTVNIESTIALSKKFFEYYTEINSQDGIFTFPVMTLAISIDDDGNFIDPDFVDWVATANATKCLGNVFINKPTSFSSCCRLLNNFENLSGIGYTNSFGVGTLSVGSHRVAGLNLPRLALLEAANPNILEENLESVSHVLVAHRRLLEEQIKGGAMPLYSTNWINLKRQYSTVGFVGMHEYLKNKGMDPVEEDSILDGLSVLKRVEGKMKEWQLKYGCTFNLEQIPAESFAVRLAKLDSLMGYNPNQFPLYSNQYLPLWEPASIFDRFKLQGRYDSLTTGGAILHITIQDSKPLTPVQFRAFLEQARLSGTVYFAINLAFSECKAHHYSIGQQEECPVCSGAIVDFYTRVVGYLSKVAAWNKTRRLKDFPARHKYGNGQLENFESAEETCCGAVSAQGD